MANQYGSSRSSRDENSVPANYQPRSRRERRELEERLVYEEQEQSYIESQDDPEGEYTDYAYEDEQDVYEPEEYDASEYVEYPEYEEEPVDFEEASAEYDDYLSEYDSNDEAEYTEDIEADEEEPETEPAPALSAKEEKKRRKKEKQALTLKQAQAEGRVSEWAWTQVRETGTIILYALIIAFVIKTFLIRGFYIPSGSMENTLQVNDRVFINVAGSYFNDPKRGDVVVFKDSQGWIPSGQKSSNPISDGLTFVGILPDTSSNYLVKRVIGLPGDTVESDGSGKIKVNGVEITEPYLHPGSNPSDIPFKVTVPEGKYFMMGDHRDNSADSRFHIADGHAFIPRDDIAGTVFVIAWPLNHFGMLDDEKKVFDSVPNP